MHKVKAFSIDGIGNYKELIPILKHATKVLNEAGVETENPVIYSPLSFDHNFVRHELISKLNYTEYNNFVLQMGKLWNSESYGLLCQTDGFPLNSTQWNNEFFNYDYIGAPWGEGLVHRGHLLKNRVGNGGFSLRSPKLFQECADIPLTGENEDFVICELYRSHLEDKGIKFAPIEIAVQFSYEVPLEEFKNSIYNTFGFHGKDPREEVRRYYGL